MPKVARIPEVPSPTVRTRISLLVGLTLVAALCCTFTAPPAVAAMKEVGESAGDFQLRDVEGRAVQLRQLLSERAALVLFSSVGCIPCEESAPAVQRMAERFADRVQVLCVMLSEPTTVDHWLEDGGRYPGARVLVGTDGEAVYGVAREYGVLGTPTAFLVGRDGTVHWRHIGRITDQQVTEALPAVLAAGVAAPGTDLLAQRSEP